MERESRSRPQGIRREEEQISVLALPGSLGATESGVPCDTGT